MFFFRRNLYINAVVFLVGMVLFFLVKNPNPLNSSFGLGEIFTVLLVFSFWLYSLWGWGSFFSSKLKLEKYTFLYILLLGSIFYIFFPMFMMIVHAIGDPFRYFFWLIIGGGILLTSPVKFSFRKIKLEFVVIFILFLFFLSAALIPHSYQDTYSYHLYAPWLWWREGKIFFPKSFHPPVLVANYWELLYLWGFSIFGSTGSALYRVQVFGQLVHLVLGFGGASIAYYAVARLFSFTRFWAILLSAFALCSPILLWTAWHAKNDYGGLFYLFMAMLLLFSSSDQRKGIFFSGFAFSLAIAMKYILFIPAFGIFLLWFFKKKVTKKMAPLFWGAALGILPLLVKNYYFTKNLLFPAFSNIFGEKIFGITATEVTADLFSFGKIPSLYQFSTQFLELLFKEPTMAISIAVALLLPFFRKKEIIFYFSYLVFVGIVMGIFLLGSASNSLTQTRFFVPFFMFSQMIAFYFLQKFTQKYRQWQKISILLILVVLVLRFNIVWSAPLKLAQFVDIKESIKTEIPGGECKVWIIENLNEATGAILSVEEDFLYLMPEGKFWSAIHHHKADQALYFASTPQKLIQDLRSQGFRHLMQSKIPEGIPFFRVSPLLWSWLHQNKQAVLYQEESCIIVDLEKL